MMQNTEFISAVRQHVRTRAISSTVQIISDPPGRAPKRDLVELSQWYKALDEHGKTMVRQLIERSVDISLFSILTVLDGISEIEDVDEQGSFKLYYVRGAEEILLNDPDETYLHDLYNAQ